MQERDTSLPEQQQDRQWVRTGQPEEAEHRSAAVDEEREAPAQGPEDSRTITLDSHPRSRNASGEDDCSFGCGKCDLSGIN